MYNAIILYIIIRDNVIVHECERDDDSVIIILYVTEGSVPQYVT